MNAARCAIRMLVLASVAGTVLFTVPETPGQVTQSWATIVDDGGLSDTGRFVVIDPAGGAIVGGTSSGLLRLSKIDPSGTVIWSHRFAGGCGSIVGLAVDGAADILALCLQSGSAVTVKVSGAGTELWRAIYDTPWSDCPVGIEVDAAGQSFVAGYTQRVEPLQVLVNSFIVSYDANGNVLWQDQYGTGKDWEQIYDIARDPVAGAVYLAGYLSGRGGGPLLVRYDADGRRRWAKKYPSRVFYGQAERVAVGPDGNVVLAGLFSSGNVDIQVIKADGANGRELWSAVYGDAGKEERVADLAIDGSGNVLISGHASTPPPIYTSVGAVLLRYTPDGALSWTVLDDRIDAGLGGLAVDSSGSSCVAGTRHVPLGPYGYPFAQHWLTTRYDATGRMVWTAEYDANPGGQVNGFSNDLALSSSGNVIVTGDLDGDVHVLSYRQP
jgi:hypothetical protein